MSGSWAPSHSSAASRRSGGRRAPDRQRPEFVIGFAVTPEQALEKFRQWLASNNWFRPGDLESGKAEVAEVLGVMISAGPLWSEWPFMRYTGRVVGAAENEALEVDFFVKYRIVDPVRFYTSTGGALSRSLRRSP